MESVACKNRIDWVDIAKGYGILLVMLGHIGFGRFGDWIYSFHLPLFLFLSGYVFTSKDDLKRFAVKKSRSLLVPYVLLLLLDIILGIKFPDFLIQSLVQKRFLQVWFIAFLLITEILYFALLKMADKDWAVIVYTALLVTVWLVMKKAVLPWNIDAALFASPFFAAGYLLKKHSEIKFPAGSKLPVIILSLALSAALTFLNTKLSGEKLDIFDSRYGSVPVTYLAAFAGICFTIALSAAFSCDFLKYIGRNSLVYFGIHNVVSMEFSKKLLAALGVAEREGPACLIYKAILFIMTLGITTLLVYLFNIGKRKMTDVVSINRD